MISKEILKTHLPKKLNKIAKKTNKMPKNSTNLSKNSRYRRTLSTTYKLQTYVQKKPGIEFTIRHPRLLSSDNLVYLLIIVFVNALMMSAQLVA